MTGGSDLGPLNWYERPPLSDTDMTDFLLLQRICGLPGSQVNYAAGQYVENGRPVLPFIADGLSALIETGHVTLGEPDPVSGASRPVLVTASGRARYEQLCTKQRVPPNPAAPSEPAAETGFQWVYAEDSFAHVLADFAEARPDALLTRCGRALPAATTSIFSVPPSLALCPICRPAERLVPPPAAFPMPTRY